MGEAVGYSSTATPLQAYIQQEYNRLKDNRDEGAPEGDFLVLDEVLMLKPPEDIPIDFSHLGTLFILDEDLDGRVTMKEVHRFAELWANQQRYFRPHEYRSQMQAYCTMRMRAAVVQSGGISIVTGWLMRLLCNNQPVLQFDNHPDVEFLCRDTIQTLHEILKIQDAYGYDFQAFFDLMQRTGEEMNIMALEDEDLDEYVPKVVVSIFINKFVSGAMDLMQELGF